MATIVLSAVGMALGGSVGGSVLGLSMATIGRAAGATLGRVIDQRILGAGSDPVETGRVDRFRLTTASEGAPVGQVFGRMRVAGQVIWATRFQENSSTAGGGKGAGPQPKTTTFSYSVSLAIALCEGEITRVGRVWADGVEIATDTLGMRVYHGTDNQACDPKIEAVEGAGNAPAYRGLAYVLFEDLALEQFGNRVPQFTFEVMRPSEPGTGSDIADIARQVQGVALIPGSGEYALATSPAYLDKGFGEKVAVNVNSPSGETDFTTAITALDEELPQCNSTLLVVSWFGNDHRCGHCDVKPKVEQIEADVADMPWRVSGQMRAAADVVPIVDDRPIYGGTPADISVVEAIKDLNARGLRPVFYPFILMEQLQGNTLPNPYSDVSGQPELPWRGRITLDTAPGRGGSTDQTAGAASEVSAFLGSAQPADFTIDGETVTYAGPSEWGYRRFILHYASLCAAAGGVSAFCIGSELRGLTQIRGAGGSFPFVEALIQLAGDVRAILGPACKISYAADWSEYHGYQPSGTGDKLFHLDPLWADPNIDFIGIDNYMPLSDWRDGDMHADAEWGSIYNLDYLASNVAGGEGFDWYYHSTEARDAQIRTPITDGEGEPWIWRVKDLVNWWGNAHHDRSNGARSVTPSVWLPKSKPIWFTEFGCAAIDKGTNQPNKFLDPKSSESSLPYYSNGARDDFLQMQYLRAIYQHFDQAENNPTSPEYNGQMLDMSRAHVWAWDTRPYPHFPLVSSLWSDGDNYARGHWLNGRSSSRTIASVITEICHASGVTNIDVSGVYGLVRGYTVADIATARSALQPLMMAYGIDASERDGLLVFSNRIGAKEIEIERDLLAFDGERQSELSFSRASDTEVTGRVQVGFLDAEGDYEAAVTETIHPDERTYSVTRSEFPIALLRGEGAEIADRWLQEASAAKDSISFGLPPSRSDIRTGDIVSLSGGQSNAQYRIDRIEEDGLRLAEATGVVSTLYQRNERTVAETTLPAFTGPTPVEMMFMDLPLLDGEDTVQAPYVAMTSNPWPGSVALYSSSADSGYGLQTVITDRSIMGTTLTELQASPLGLWDRQAGLEVKLVSGTLSSKEVAAVLNGSNTIAIGDGSADGWEIIQFVNAEPIAPQVVRLERFLRGQVGSDATQPMTWPQGSIIVFLDARPDQIAISPAARGISRHYRFGPASRPFDDASYRHAVHTYSGIGLRPYRVCHLRARIVGGTTYVSWIRRTRVDGDIWGQVDVPLSETVENYHIEVHQGGNVVRVAETTMPSWTYGAAEQAADLSVGAFELAVAQVSDRFGVGPLRQISLNYSP